MRSGDDGIGSRHRARHQFSRALDTSDGVARNTLGSISVLDADL